MDTTVRIEGLDELRRSFKQAGGPLLARQLGKAHKSIAQKVVIKVKPAVQGAPTPGGSKATITASGTQKHAAVRFKGGRKSTAIATVLGRKVHTARAGRDWRYARRIPLGEMKRPVWKPHLGNSWKASQLYGAGPVLEQAKKTFIIGDYKQAISETLRQSFT